MELTSLVPLPAVATVGLSDEEKALVRRLQTAGIFERSQMELTESYYQGAQVVSNLRIAIPKELEFIRTIVGWPAVAVDPLVERLFVDGFRLADATDSDTHLAELWEANNCDAEQSLAFTDALSMRYAYWMVGAPLEAGGAPRITVESPLSTAVLWDLRGINATAALSEYVEGEQRRATLLVPNQSIHLALNDRAEWEVVARDVHDFGFVPIERMANKPRTHNRSGSSEITNALMSTVDSACRTLLGLEVSRELYSVPQRVLLGATEGAFQKTDGTAKSAWETYITRVLAIERDESGDLPEIKQLPPYDPGVFTKLIEMYASQAAGQMGAVPQDLGLYHEGNPTSAESAQVAESRRDRRAILRQSMFGGSLVRVMQHALRFENGGDLPDQYRRLAVDWRDVKLADPVGMSDAITKQTSQGIVPATSDVVLKRLGYTAVERRQLEQDRRADTGVRVAQRLADTMDATSAPGQR